MNNTDFTPAAHLLASMDLDGLNEFFTSGTPTRDHLRLDSSRLDGGRGLNDDEVELFRSSTAEDLEASIKIREANLAHEGRVIAGLGVLKSLMSEQGAESVEDLTDEGVNRAWVRGASLDICETCYHRVNGRDDSTTEVFEAVTAAFHPVACSGTVIVEELDRLGDSCNLCLTPHGDGTIYAASAQPRKTD